MQLALAVCRKQRVNRISEKIFFKVNWKDRARQEKQDFNKCSKHLFAYLHVNPLKDPCDVSGVLQIQQQNPHTAIILNLHQQVTNTTLALNTSLNKNKILPVTISFSFTNKEQTALTKL